MKKGQMFLLGALVIVTIIVILKFSVSLPSTIEEKRVLENKFEKETYENILKEMNNTIRFSYVEPENITKNVFDFSNFTEEKIKQSSMNLEILFIGGIANKTSNKFNLTVINMLDQNIEVNLTMNDSESTLDNLLNYQTANESFNITPGNDYNLKVTFEEFEENVTFSSKASKDVYLGFFYISIESESAEHKSIFKKEVSFNE